MAFTVTDPDFKHSPFTGMTRKHWLETATFLLDGVFMHIPNFDAPIILPRQHTISYPQPDSPKWQFQAEQYEGLARTFMAASHLIRESPDLSIQGYNLREYYANQILRAVNPESEGYLGSLSGLLREHGLRHFQHTVEGAALVIGLMNCRSEIWNAYTRNEQNQVAEYISDAAHNRTLSHNWRFFNVLMLTFLKRNEYPIDEAALRDHLQHLMSYYAGNGWYRDHSSFDYYNAWAFQFYGPIWCSWYGYEHEPRIAQIIEKRHHEFTETYPLMFSRQGHQLMWGRSIIYRCAAASSLGAAFLLNNTRMSPGWARRIASGNLLQFLTREDVFFKHVPCLGYYGLFEPLVQFYSCSASPFWMSKIYTALSLPADSPFWTETEETGVWRDLKDQQKTITLPGPGLTLTVHGKTGTSELRPGKVANNLPYNNRLAYNSSFLWESDSPEGATAMTYSIKQLGKDTEFAFPLTISFCKEEAGVIYRQLNLGLGDTYFGPARIDLADIIIPGGVIRIDRARIAVRHEIHLGHFGLPHSNGQTPRIQETARNGARAIIASISNRQLALVACRGWDRLGAMEHTGKNAEAEKSTVLYAERIRNKDYSGMELFVTLMLHRTDNEDFSDSELFPIRKLTYRDWTRTDQPCGVELTLTDGQVYQIDFGNIEGQVSQ